MGPLGTAQIVEGVPSYALTTMGVTATQKIRKMTVETSVQSVSVWKESDTTLQGNLHKIAINVTSIFV